MISWSWNETIKKIFCRTQYTYQYITINVKTVQNVLLYLELSISPQILHISFTTETFILFGKKMRNFRVIVIVYVSNDIVPYDHMPTIWLVGLCSMRISAAEQDNY